MTAPDPQLLIPTPTMDFNEAKIRQLEAELLALKTAAATQRNKPPRPPPGTHEVSVSYRRYSEEMNKHNRFLTAAASRKKPPPTFNVRKRLRDFAKNTLDSFEKEFTQLLPPPEDRVASKNKKKNKGKRKRTAITPPPAPPITV